MIVTDASVANKLFLPNEEGYTEVLNIFQKHAGSKEEIIVPDLIFYEVANTLTTKSAVTLTQVIKSLNQLYKFNLNVDHSANKDITEAVKFSKKYKVSVYDGIYAVLAKKKKCTLITADIKFAKQINLPFVKILYDISKA